MFIRIQLSYNEDYMFAINGPVWTNKKAGEVYINGENIESCVDIGDKWLWLPLADIEKKFENKIKNAEKEMLKLEKERLELRLTQVKRMMDK